MKKLWVLFLLVVGILCFNGISFASTEGEYDITDNYLTSGSAITLEAPSGTTTSKDSIVTVNVALNEANSIGATDMTVNYDSDKLSLVSAEGINGQEVIYQTTTTTSGSAIRLVTVSDSKESFIKDSGNVVQLKFKAFSEGNALIDVTAGKVANTHQEYTLPSSRLGQLSIFIAPSDVNNDGVTNLVDLALISYYRGYNANSVPSGYFPDKNGDGIIDQIDLQQILTQYLG